MEEEKKYLNKKNSKSKGITLISLVITIIILIILTGISITSLTGENGLFKKAFIAKQMYDNTTIKEQIQIAKHVLKIEDKDITAQNVKDYLVKSHIYKEEEVEVLTGEEEDKLKIKDTIVNGFKKAVFTLYFEKGEEWIADTIYAYVWGDNGEYKAWPGIQMKLIEGTNNIYTFEVPADYRQQNIIFSNGQSGSNAIQTNDLKIPDKTGYIFKNTDATSRDVYLQATNWTGKANIHIWNAKESKDYTKWPGVEAEYVRTEGNWQYYKYTLPEGFNDFLFVEVKENGSTGIQTRDFSIEPGSSKTVYAHGNILCKDSGTIVLYSNGKWYKYE